MSGSSHRHLSFDIATDSVFFPSRTNFWRGIPLHRVHTSTGRMVEFDLGNGPGEEESKDEKQRMLVVSDEGQVALSPIVRV